MEFIQTILATLVTLGILVTIHEWGHYWVARRCGVKVLQFSVGFGKALWSRRGKDGTLYTISAIPLGGFVRMLDEREGEVPEELRSQAFNNKPVLQRIAVVAAGPLVNLIFALFAYWLMFVVGVSAIKPVVGDVVESSPAATASLPVDVEIVGVDGVDVRSWEEVNLRLAARVGETGTISLLAKTSPASIAQEYRLEINEWQVDLENQSPLSAAGVIPFRPEIDSVLGQIVEGGAAESAGLESGDQIISVNGEPVNEWMMLVKKIQASPGSLLELEVLRDGSELMIDVTPAERPGADGRPQGFIGAGVQMPEWPEGMIRTIEYGPFAAIPAAFNKTTQMIGLTLDSIWKMIEGVISVKNLSGPITIAKVAGASAASGFEPFISFLAYLSISLGVLNLLPIPVLDGGHLVYYVIELVRGKPVSEKVQLIGFKIGMAVLLSLMTLAIVNDFMRL